MVRHMGIARHLRGKAVSAAWYSAHVPLACCNLRHHYSAGSGVDTEV